jgi:hypothetical protein
MDLLIPFTTRTEAKMRYARIHLDELRTHKQRGSADDFESAHQESYLFHLLSALDSFLQELNICYGCSLSINRVTRKNLRNALNRLGQHSQELEELTSLEHNPESWLSQAKEMRDHSTHRHRVARVFYEGGELSGQVRLRHPETGRESDSDWLIQFESWYQYMTELLPRLRATALEHLRNFTSTAG